jgi:hypothetical protein
MIFQSRSGDGDDKTIKASADIAKKFGMGADDVSRDGSTVLLTEKVAFRNFVLLGAPACGKTTLLRKNQSISHYCLPAWPASPIVLQSTYSVCLCTTDSPLLPNRRKNAILGCAHSI